MYGCELKCFDGRGELRFEMSIEGTVEAGAACDALRQCPDIDGLEITAVTPGYSEDAPGDSQLGALRVGVEIPLLLVRAAASLPHAKGCSLHLSLPATDTALGRATKAFWDAWLLSPENVDSRFNGVTVSPRDAPAGEP